MLTRVAGVDTSNALGADNLVTFGQPKNMDEEGSMAWVVKAVHARCWRQMATDTIKRLHNAELPVEAVPGAAVAEDDEEPDDA